MTTKAKHVAFQWVYLVGKGDCGYWGTPGSAASRNLCWLEITRTNRWVARGQYSTGSNQGYYQENYSYGPWEGRGDTPGEAIASMMSSVDSDYIEDIRKSSHDAKLDAEDRFGPQWCDKTWAEFGIACQQQLIDSKYQSNQYSPFEDKSDEGIDDWRAREIKRLKKLCNDRPLANVSNEDLLTEVRLRGLA